MTQAAALRYPLGPFETPAADDLRAPDAARRDIRELPERLGAALEGLTDAQLDTPYRPGGWTVRQLVHHLADSHVNAYCRTRLALTEVAPTIRVYDQDHWSQLADAGTAPVQPSLRILEGLHARWSLLLDGLTSADFGRPLLHPELGEMTLGQLLAYYGWHSRHHVAHILILRARSRW